MTSPSSSLDASPYRNSSPVSIPRSDRIGSKYTVRKKIPSSDADKSTIGKTINAAQIITPEHSPINSFAATFTEELFTIELEGKSSKSPQNDSEAMGDCGLFFQNASKPKQKVTEFSFIDPPGSQKNTFTPSPDDLKVSFRSLFMPSTKTSIDDPILMHGKNQIYFSPSTKNGSPSFLETPPAVGNLLGKPVSANFLLRPEKSQLSEGTDIPAAKTPRPTTPNLSNHLDLFGFEL